MQKLGLCKIRVTYTGISGKLFPLGITKFATLQYFEGTCNCEGGGLRRCKLINHINILYINKCPYVKGKGKVIPITGLLFGLEGG